jgi:hypothetical protein
VVAVRLAVVAVDGGGVGCFLQQRLAGKESGAGDEAGARRRLARYGAGGNSVDQGGHVLALTPRRQDGVVAAASISIVVVIATVVVATVVTIVVGTAIEAPPPVVFVELLPARSRLFGARLLLQKHVKGLRRDDVPAAVTAAFSSFSCRDVYVLRDGVEPSSRGVARGGRREQLHRAPEVRRGGVHRHDPRDPTPTDAANTAADGNGGGFCVRGESRRERVASDAAADVRPRQARLRGVVVQAECENAKFETRRSHFRGSRVETSHFQLVQPHCGDGQRAVALRHTQQLPAPLPLPARKANRHRS